MKEASIDKTIGSLGNPLSSLPAPFYPVIIKGMNAKRFLRKLIAVILILLVAAGGIVFLVDPYFHYHKPWFGLSAVQTEKEYQVPGALAHLSYDSVIVGSSVTENNDAAWFQATFGCNVVKAVRSYGGIADLRWYLDRAFDAKSGELSYVFWNLDPSSLALPPETTFRASGCPMYLYDRNPFNDIEYLWNMDVLVEKIPTMILKSHQGYNQGQSYNWWEGKTFSTAAALSHYTRPSAVLPEKSADAYEENLRGNIALLTEAVTSHPDTNFYFFFPPYSILWWDGQIRSGAFEADLYNEEETIKALLSLPNVRVFQFQNVSEITADLDHYMDALHFTPMVNEMMVDCMYDGSFEVKAEGAGDGAVSAAAEQCIEDLRNFALDAERNVIPRYEEQFIYDE